MPDVTQILSEIQAGRSGAGDRRIDGGRRLDVHQDVAASRNGGGGVRLEAGDLRPELGTVRLAEKILGKFLFRVGVPAPIPRIVG